MTNMPIPRQQSQGGGGTTDVTNNQAFVTNTTTIPATTLMGYRCDETATSRDPRNLLAAYEDRRKSRVRQLNVWLSISEAKKFNIAAGCKHCDDISQCHENAITAFNSDDDAVDNFGRRDAVLPLTILTEILGSCYGSSSAMQPPPYLESHPDDVLFTSCKNLCELIDFTALDSEPKSLFSESNNGPEDTKNNQF